MITSSPESSPCHRCFGRSWTALSAQRSCRWRAATWFSASSSCRPEFAPLAVSYQPHVRSLFEPLGYKVELESPVFGLPALLLRLLGIQSLTDVVRHLFVLVPALDEAKQAPLNAAEAGRLRTLGLPWLTTHPKRSFIARSYHLRLATLLGAPPRV